MSSVAWAASLLTVSTMYVVGRCAFGSARTGLLTAALCASTPVLWAAATRADHATLAVAVVCAWLASVSLALETRALQWWLVGGLALGAGLWTTWSAMVMMPLYFVLTGLCLGSVEGYRATRRQLAMLAIGFGVSAAPFAVYVYLQRENVRRTIDAIGLYDADRFTVLQGLREMASWVGLTARSEVYYDSFNPAFLFLGGDVLLLPLAVLVPAGLYRLLDDATVLGRIALFGFLLAPVAAALTAAPPIPRRMLYLVPFAALVSAHGVRQILSWRRHVSHLTRRPIRPRRGAA